MFFFLLFFSLLLLRMIFADSRSLFFYFIGRISSIGSAYVHGPRRIAAIDFKCAARRVKV